MMVKELIKLLQEMPPEMEVTAWDAEADEYLPITHALYEDGHSTVDLLTTSAEAA